jgi:hypothetical protein
MFGQASAAPNTRAFLNLGARQREKAKSVRDALVVHFNSARALRCRIRIRRNPVRLGRNQAGSETNLGRMQSNAAVRKSRAGGVPSGGFRGLFVRATARLTTFRGCCSVHGPRCRDARPKTGKKKARKRQKQPRQKTCGASIAKRTVGRERGAPGHRKVMALMIAETWAANARQWPAAAGGCKGRQTRIASLIFGLGYMSVQVQAL